VRYFTPFNHKVLHLIVLSLLFFAIWLVGFAVWSIFPVLPLYASALLCLPVATVSVIVASVLCHAGRRHVSDDHRPHRA
jgi:hypothetical protein